LALGTYSADDLILGTNQLARVHVKSDGKVGIGTASPGQLLSVAGTVESTSGGFKFPDGTTQTTALSATTVTGTGTSGRCTYWTGSQTVDDDAGCLYDSSTDKLGILGQIVVGPQSPTYGIGVKGLINVDQTRAASGSISTFVPTLRVKAALSGERANSVFSGDVSGTLIEVDNTSYGLPFSDPYGSLASVMFHQLKPGFEGDSGAWVVGSDEDYYTGNITNGVNTITGMSPTTTLLAVGMPVVGQGIPAGTTISSVNSSTQITMSANATATVTGAVLSIGIGAGYNTGTISATTYSSNPNRSPGGIKSSIVYRSKLPLQVASGTSWKGGDDDYAGGGWGAAFWTENASAVANPNIHGVFLANYASWPDTGFVTNQLGAAVLVDVFTGADNNAWTDAFRVTPAGPGGGTSGAYMRIIADGSVMINTPSSFTGTSVEVKHNSATLFAITYDAHFYAALPTTSSSVYYVCIDNSTSELFRKATACN
jgi:hypothetical protein